MDTFFVELLRTHAAHWNVSRQGFAKLDISDGVPKILYILNGFEGCVQKELAELCQIKESTLTVMLRRLETMGYIRKEKVLRSGGKRAFGIYLTKEGKEMAEKIRNLVEQIDKQSLSGFSQEEREQFISYMKRVQKNLEEFEI